MDITIKNMAQDAKPIWVESLMTAQEYKECSQKYPNTYKSNKPPYMFEGEFYWRLNMGGKLNTKQIKLQNERLDQLKLQADVV